MGTPSSRPNWKSEFLTMSDQGVFTILNACLTEVQVMARHLRGFEPLGYYGGRSPLGSPRISSPELFRAAHKMGRIEIHTKVALVCELSRLPKNPRAQITSREIWLSENGAVFFWLTRYNTETRGGSQFDTVSEMDFETVQFGGPKAQPEGFFSPLSRREVIGEVMWKAHTLFEETVKNRRFLLEKAQNGMARVERSLETICTLPENS